MLLFMFNPEPRSELPTFGWISVTKVKSQFVLYNLSIRSYFHGYYHENNESKVKHMNSFRLIISHKVNKKGLFINLYFFPRPGRRSPEKATKVMYVTDFNPMF